MRTSMLIATAGVALGGCSVSQDKATAEAEVAHFHQMLDAGRYHDIYAGAEPEFRQTASEQDAIRVLQTVHDRLGAFRSSQQSGWRVNFATGGAIVNLTYNTQFAAAAGSEDFVFRMRGPAAHLVGYHVNSPALIRSGAPPAQAAGKPGESAAPSAPSEVRLAEPPKPAETQPSGGK